MSDTMPLVSIGVPVYNGEKGLARALDSLREQDYPNLEIVVSDNASTDETPEICAEYVRRDPRVKYSRSPENRGSFWNFNRVVELSSGKYFMWAAHDDRRAPAYVRKCVEVLEADPAAVLCHSHTELRCEGYANTLCTATLETIDGINDPVERYKMVLRTFPQVAVYGLMRLEAVRKTLLFEKHLATDQAFVQELALYGSFRQVPEIMFAYFSRLKWNTIDEDYRNIFPGKRKPKYYLPFFILAKSHIRRILRSPMKTSTKLCLSWIVVCYNIRIIMSKIIARSVTFINKGTCPEIIRKSVEEGFLDNINIKPVDKDLFDSLIRRTQLRSWLGREVK